ncbi:hypothetical protein DFH06DRAFT_1233748 [Mycena polygramma]|nr:hypothetical protein DFH06DRAFT_1233748 [Mycena polygramma]
MLSPVHADRARVAELAAEITLLELCPSESRNENIRVQARLDAVKYPVLTLPTEIVAEIFLHFLPVYPLCPPLAGIFSPTILTYICRHWREIALSTPILWRAMAFFGDTKLPLTSRSDFDNTLARELQISDIWLRRSRHYPLSIALSYYRWPVSEIYAAIVPHRARWEHITFHTAPSDLPTIVGPMPLLQHLDLTVDHRIHHPVEISDAPQLHTVVLSDFASWNIALPWAQLTDLTLNWVHPGLYLPILRQTSNLRHCELIIFYWGPDDGPPPELALPFLESLAITLATPEARRGIRFPHIFVVPALRRLQIPESILGQDPVDYLRSFVATAGCTLQSLHITDRRSIANGSFNASFQNLEVSFDDWHASGSSD